MPNMLQAIDHRYQYCQHLLENKIYMLFFRDPYIVDYPKRNDPYSFGLGKRSTDDSHSLLPSLLWGIPLKHPVIRSVKRTDPVAWGFLDPKQHKSDPYAFGLGR